MRVFKFAVLLLSLSIPSVAHSADKAAYPPANVAGTQAYDWSGAYVGLQVGYEQRDDFVADPNYPLWGTINFDGAAVGGHLGYDRQFGSIVVGAVGDIEWTNGDGVFGPLIGGVSTYGYAKANWQGSLRARLGYAKDRFLIYGTGGLAFGNFDFDFESSFGTAFGSGDQFSETMTGYTVGAGVAYAIRNGFELSLDYRYSDFGKATNTIVNCCAPLPDRQEHDVTTSTFRLGISRRF